MAEKLGDIISSSETGLTHVLRCHSLERREEKENDDENYPRDGDGANREVPLAQTERSGDEFVTAGSDAQEDWQCIGCIESNHCGSISDGVNKHVGGTRIYHVPSKRGQGGIGKSQKPANRSANHHEPDGIYRCLRATVDLFPPAGAGQSVVPRKCKDHARSVHSLCGSRNILKRNPRVTIIQSPLFKRGYTPAQQ